MLGCVSLPSTSQTVTAEQCGHPHVRLMWDDQHTRQGLIGYDRSIDQKFAVLGVRDNTPYHVRR